MSYAASVAKDTLTEAELERYSLSFRNYSAISVREKNAVEILQPASPIKIQWVLDPVFLLGRKKWDSLGGDKKIKKKDQIQINVRLVYVVVMNIQEK